MEGATKLAVIGLGGALGAVARYLVNFSPLSSMFQSFPLATFLINVSGSFAIGFLTIVFAEKFEVSDNVRAAVIVGFLGAFTTFSTFEYEILDLYSGKQTMTALLYVVLSVLVGFIGVVSGVALANRL
jgi:CrcB protein